MGPSPASDYHHGEVRLAGFWLSCIAMPHNVDSLELVPPDPDGCFVQGLLASHLENFLETVRGQSDGALQIPEFVVNQLLAMRDCGNFTKGFLRLQCNKCREPRMVPFSCKGRLCPSCAGRRMAEGSAYLADRVLRPDLRWRQYVLSFPPELARALCFRSELASRITGIVRRALVEWQLARAPNAEMVARSGGVIFLQRCTDTLDPWFHPHILLPDAVFRDVADSLEMSVEHQPPPGQADIQGLVDTISRRVLDYLRRFSDFPPDHPVLARCASQPYRQLRGDATPPPTRRLRKPAPLLAAHNGFTLHANTSVAPDDTDGLERLLRYLNRPTLSRERIELTSDHQVLLTLKKKRRNGVKRILLEPHAFLARLCALIPPPMSNQTIDFGVLAAGSGARPHCIPTPPPSSPTRPTAPERPATMAWAELLQRTFAIDIRQCPCGGWLKLTAVIESPDVFQATAAAIILSNQTPTRMTTGP